MAASDDELIGYQVELPFEFGTLFVPDAPEPPPPGLVDEVLAQLMERPAPRPLQPGEAAPTPAAQVVQRPVTFVRDLARLLDEPAEAEIHVLPDDIDGKIARAEAAITELLRRGHPICCAWSAGKDSSTVLNLLLSAAAKLKAAGEDVPPIVVTHADTGIENPEMSAYARNEMVQVREFARRRGLEVEIHVSHPNLSDQWATRVIGGRALPPFPGTNRDCSTSWKVKPQAKLRKKVLTALRKQCSSAGAEPVVLIGTRYEESDERARRMRERGESDVEVRRGKDAAGNPSHLFLSPVAFWSADDVWEYLGTARAGGIESYSDFEETFRVYADAMATSCAVVAEDMAKLAKASKACGARHGCSLCTAVGCDQSMENMLTQERYHYMRGLNQLRNFLSNTRWDMGRRSWLGRTINEGYIRIAPDAYSPAMMEELLRYSLTIDVEEREAASRLGIRPRFQLVTIEHLFAIDAMWSLQGFHRPFHALAIYDEICNRGARHPVPEVPVCQRPKEFPERFLFVGADWEDGWAYQYTGLRSAVHELTAMDSEGCMGNKLLPDGTQVMDINTEKMLEVEAETAYFVLDELPRVLRQHDDPRVSPTEAYFYYLRLGVISVKAGQEKEIDAMLRRTNWKFRQGLAGEIDHRVLLDRCVGAAEAGRTRSRNGAARERAQAGSRSEAFLRLDIGEAGASPAGDQAPHSPVQMQPRQRTAPD
ncbi:phosphoadenosine phosphosulfate reductase domain-containing protein [Ramlibacter sp. AN1133]|uniref:phosphoadenosine phosphosulfate reductase domain-containing protein n=1 Tax=Ramlibacter sp. AN1133 TaxID=3133429 RepID=UPI0030C1BA8D